MSGLFGDELPSEENMTLAKVLETQNTFRPGFYLWLRDNFGIWRRFVQEADKIRGTGRDHYGARTIGEYLRHQTALRENDSQFKCDNNVWPDCARLYMLMRPESKGFFELRRSGGRGE